MRRPLHCRVLLLRIGQGHDPQEGPGLVLWEVLGEQLEMGMAPRAASVRDAFRDGSGRAGAWKTLRAMASLQMSSTLACSCKGRAMPDGSWQARGVAQTEQEHGGMMKAMGIHWLVMFPAALRTQQPCCGGLSAWSGYTSRHWPSWRMGVIGLCSGPLHYEPLHSKVLLA